MNRLIDGLYHSAIVVLVLIILLHIGCRNAEQQREMHWLDSMLYDLEHPTAENDAIRRVWCKDAGAKADSWRLIPGWDTKRKVDRYLKACALELR